MTIVHAILLVGGKGTRLLPHTADQPKALIRLGRYAILEIILRRLRAFGFDRVTLCVSHLGEMIRAEFGSGAALGLSIEYSVDERPLGTAAPLLLTENWDTPAVVMNGDILTTIDFGDLLRRHQARQSLLTVAFVRRRLSAGVGLVRVIDGRIREVLEKPTFDLNVSSGIYAVSPAARKYIPRGGPADMPDLINALIRHDEPVHGYGFSGAWHDIGTPLRYDEARKAFEADPDRYLGPDPATGRDQPADGAPGAGLDDLAAGLDVGVLLDRSEARA
ncbi:sugar phosphate nucleotidyltransferase [Amycolatopsis anabasis]|uniref:sugar phosphate nucleotidyltransferase n=1 Tax=Amycolatopsis anabasis TaxID=1840409 RepID=UPI001C553BEC|nr:sugar phosphate nucleotidyltransferase [Amycolatopsis anabasis]